ncbi:hypothetical protein HAX54_007252 [Datura stramonium]|uniref:Uncharacterized protein n=1 Tax=Datura stramonium TaxID=4076 RepID=A0ABS8TDW8_DATST|nr:hypothetical protein [Datura stramonium]
MPPAVERLARKYLRNSVVATIGTAGKATDLITQHVFMVKESDKVFKLQRLLDELGDKTAIVFINSRKRVDTVAKNLDKACYRQPHCMVGSHRSRGKSALKDLGQRGRAGKSGVATPFLTLQDTEVFYDLKQMLIQSNSPVPRTFSRHEASKFKPGSILADHLGGMILFYH